MPARAVGCEGRLCLACLSASFPPRSCSLIVIPFSFVHAADLHLDSPFKGITARNPQVADALRQATFDAFASLVDLCLAREADFVVIAGDVYDWADRSVRAQLRFRDGIVRLAERDIRAFVVYGNHDPLVGRSSPLDWPDSLRIFGCDGVETVKVSREGGTVAAVSGISYRKQRECRNLARLFPRDRGEVFSIGLLHCNAGGDTAHEPYAPCDVQDLVSSGIDYWALGHVHQRRILHRDPFVVYPGNPQGRSFREQGERGCYLVSVGGGGDIDLEFCPLDAVRWDSATVDIEGIETIDRLDRAIVRAVESMAERSVRLPLVSRVSLTGRGPLSSELRRNGAVDQLLERVQTVFLAENPFVWVEAILPECLPEVDFAERRRVSDFLGQILRDAEEIRGSHAGPLREELEEALGELWGHRRAARALDPLTDEDLDEILTAAELLCLDKLEGADQ